MPLRAAARRLRALIPLKDNIPTDRFPLVTVALILANALVYLVFQRGGILHGASEHSVLAYGAIPYELAHPGQHCVVFSDGHAICRRDLHDAISPWLKPFVSMFMHASIVHIAGNMLFLWIFGNNVEDSMGRVRFIAFYLLGGVAAFALQTAVDPSAAVPMLGASGAIAGVLGGYILLYPRARVLTLVFLFVFVTIIELPAVLMLGVWIVEQALFGAANLTNPTGGGGGVAYFAHIGGFIFGAAAIRAFITRRKRVPPRALA